MRLKKTSIPDAVAYLENIIAAVHESILILDANLCVHEASASFYKKFEVTPDETVDKPIYELGNGQWDIPKLRELLEQVIPQDEVVENFQVTHTFENIGKRTMLLNARRFNCAEDEDQQMLLLAINDITQLDDVQNELETKVEELRVRNEELDAFAHTVAHDLKNPISSMIGFATLIQSYYERMERDDVMDNLNAIIESGEHIKSIINSLLLLAGVDRNNDVELEPLDMHRIVEQVKRSLNTMIKESDAHLNLPDEWATPLGYAPWITAVWTNYITNAIKYGGDPPVIELGWEPCPNGDLVHFWVQDNGAGLTTDEQKTVFKPFARLADEGVEGHGLGLSVVQKVTEKLGGTVTLDSTPGEGSRFGFTLPRA